MTEGRERNGGDQARFFTRIAIDGLEVYKSSEKCPRLNYMLHN